MNIELVMFHCKHRHLFVSFDNVYLSNRVHLVEISAHYLKIGEDMNPNSHDVLFGTPS